MFSQLQEKFFTWIEVCYGLYKTLRILHKFSENVASYIHFSLKITVQYLIFNCRPYTEWKRFFCMYMLVDRAEFLLIGLVDLSIFVALQSMPDESENPNSTLAPKSYPKP